MYLRYTNMNLFEIEVVCMRMLGIEFFDGSEMARNYQALSKIVKGKEKEFEDVWKNRDTHLKGVNGFKEFHLVKGNESEDHTLYASHSIWASKDAFIDWTKSEAFRLAHKNAGQHKDLYLGAPNFEGFEVVI